MYQTFRAGAKFVFAQSVARLTAALFISDAPNTFSVRELLTPGSLQQPSLLIHR